MNVMKNEENIITKELPAEIQFHVNLRDYFAAMPLGEFEIGIIRTQFEAKHAGVKTYTLQELKYFHADEMLKQRNKL